MESILRCWCGNTDLLEFSPDYLKCPLCETLIVRQFPEIDVTHVHSDEDDFYGREYWFSHQEKDLGFTDITTRARSDLAERCLHWLRTVLKYKLPPGKVLELGSAHGGFVALLRCAGYDATGLELSPGIVDFARQTFDIPMLLGPIEDQSIDLGSLGVIALMDVLEHLPDPIGTMRRCLELLTPDGVLVIQTPRYPEGKTYEDLSSTQDAFLLQLKANEHLYLFSQSAIREFFHRLGADYLTFEPAMFAHYDMFLVVCRSPFARNAAAAIEQSLAQTVSGRLVQALLDVDEQRRMTHQKWQDAEADRGARLKILNEQGEKFGAHIAAIEADRGERLAVIESLGSQLGKAVAERNDTQAQLKNLRDHFDAVEADRTALRQELNELQSQLPVKVLRRLRLIQDRAVSSATPPQEDQR